MRDCITTLEGMEFAQQTIDKIEFFDRCKYNLEVLFFDAGKERCMELDIEIDTDGRLPGYSAIIFKITSDPISVEIIVDNPDRIPYTEWMEFASDFTVYDRYKYLDLYRMHGDHIYYIEKNDDETVTFVNDQSGCGNNSSHKTTIPAEIFNPRMLECLERMKDLGLIH